jgi:hypothetical protein
MHREELQRRVDEHRYNRDLVFLEDVGETSAVASGHSHTKSIQEVSTNVTLAPWSSWPNVTSPPLESDLCGERDIDTWGKRDNLDGGRRPEHVGSELSVELLSEFTSRLEEVVGDAPPMPDVSQETGVEDA